MHVYCVVVSFFAPARIVSIFARIAASVESVRALSAADWGLLFFRRSRFTRISAESVAGSDFRSRAPQHLGSACLVWAVAFATKSVNAKLG